jgi:hypothetical protein
MPYSKEKHDKQLQVMRALKERRTAENEAEERINEYLVRKLSVLLQPLTERVDAFKDYRLVWSAPAMSQNTLGTHVNAVEQDRLAKKGIAALCFYAGKTSEGSLSANPGRVFAATHKDGKVCFFYQHYQGAEREYMRLDVLEVGLIMYLNDIVDLEYTEQTPR